MVAAFQQLKTQFAVPVPAAGEDAGVDHCHAAARKAFPEDGDFGSIPKYFSVSYKTAGTAAVGALSGSCVLTDQPTRYSIYTPDAYRRCAYENRPAAAGGTVSTTVAATAGDLYYVAPVVPPPQNVCSVWHATGTCPAATPVPARGTWACFGAVCTMPECCEPAYTPPAFTCGAAFTCDQGDVTSRRPPTTPCPAAACTAAECCATSAALATDAALLGACGPTAGAADRPRFASCPSALPQVRATAAAGSAPAAAAPCAAALCRIDECCEPAVEAAPAGTCAGFHAAAPNGAGCAGFSAALAVALPAGTPCVAAACTPRECCSSTAGLAALTATLATCGALTQCPAARPVLAQPATVCAGAACRQSECCGAATCATHFSAGCSGAKAKARAAAAATIVCAPTATQLDCTLDECCVAATCANSLAGGCAAPATTWLLSRAKTSGAPATLVCAAAACTRAECCENATAAEPTCGANFVTTKCAAHATLKKCKLTAVTTCAAAVCTEAECCEAFPADTLPVAPLGTCSADLQGTLCGTAPWARSRPLTVYAPGCTTAECTAEECCYKDPTADGGTDGLATVGCVGNMAAVCTPASQWLPDQAPTAGATCAADPCTAQECCVPTPLPGLYRASCYPLACAGLVAAAACPAGTIVKTGGITRAGATLALADCCAPDPTRL